MSAGIKRMLAEREARKRASTDTPRSLAKNRAAFARIAAAAPALDAAYNGNGWKSSELARIGYCVLATSRNPEDADDFLSTFLAQGTPDDGEEANARAERKL